MVYPDSSANVEILWQNLKSDGHQSFPHTRGSCVGADAVNIHQPVVPRAWKWCPGFN